MQLPRLPKGNKPMFSRLPGKIPVRFQPRHLNGGGWHLTTRKSAELFEDHGGFDVAAAAGVYEHMDCIAILCADLIDPLV